MNDWEEMRDYWEFKLETYYNSIMSMAHGNGFVYIDRMQKFAEFPNVTEGNYIDILCRLRDENIEILPNPKYSPNRESLKDLLKEIRKYKIEQENRPEGSKGEDPIRLYFDEITQIPLITPNEERDLIFDIADGNEEAKEQLIESSLFIPIAAAYKQMGSILFLDLVQEGNMELLAAAEDFDYGKNISFFAYAAFRIYKRLIELNEEKVQTVRLSNGLAEDISKILRYRKENTAEITDEELAKALGMTMERLTEAKKVLQDIDSDNDSPAVDEKETEMPAVKKSDAEEQLSKQVSQMLAALPEKEATVIAMRFGIGYPKAMTAEEIAEKLGEDINQIKKTENSAMRHLGT